MESLRLINSNRLTMKNTVAFLFIFLTITSYAQKKWTLQECISYAMKNNLTIHQGNLNKKIQDYQLVSAKKEKLPGVSASISNNTNFGQSQDVFGNSQRNDNFNNSANVGTSILVFNNGRLEKNIRKTEFDVQASQYDVEKTKNDISVQIAQQYLNILLNREVEKINRSAYENAVKVYDRAKITTEVGTTALTVLAEAEAAKAREYQNVKSAEVNTKNSLFSLAMLLQLEDYRSFDVADAPDIKEIASSLFTTDDVLAKAYESQPQIKAAESRIRSAETQTDVVKTQYWPSITASAGIGSYYYNSLVTNNIGYSGNYIKEKDFFRQYSDNFGQQIGLSASIPIFNKGLTRIQVEQAKINEDIARNSLLLEKQDVLKNVQQAQYSAENYYEVYKAAVEAEKSSALALDYAEKSYAAGRTTIYDVNTARNNYASAQGNTAQAKFNYIFQQKLIEFYAGIPLSL